MKRSSFSRAAVIERAKAIYQRTRITWGEALAAAYREAAASDCPIHELVRNDH